MLHKRQSFSQKKAILKNIYTLYMYEDKKKEDKKMGFLLFAFRKLSLKREINQKNYRMTLLSNQRQRIDSEISIMEQHKAAQQDAWSTISNSISSSTNTIFQMNASQSNTDVIKSVNVYSKDYQLLTKFNSFGSNDKADRDKFLETNNIDNSKSDDEIRKSLEGRVESEKIAMTKQQLSAQDSNQANQLAMQASQLALVTANQCVNSVFASMDETKLAMLQSQDQRIDTEMGQLESEVELLNAEYENVKKAESQEAKNTAPSFGLA